MKQQDLADLLGLSKSYVSEIESGKKTPSLEVIDKYAKAFGIPSSSILFFAENISEPNKASRSRSQIAGKVLKFLQFIEVKTADGTA